MASRVTHAILGDVEFDPEQDENVWETKIEWEGRTVRVDLWFDGASMSPSVLDSLARFVTDIAGFDELARQSIRQEFDSLVGDYLDFDDAGDLLQVVFGTEDNGSVDIDAETFLSPMHLVRIGLYPDEPDTYAVFDYTLGRELTDNLVAVKFDDRLKVADVAVES